MRRRLVLLVLAALPLAGCGGSSEKASAPAPDAPRVIQVTSPAFGKGQAIPPTYTCHGKGISPSLRWSGVPADAGSAALVVDDPDAPGGGYVHWLVVGLPAGTGAVDEGESPATGTELEGSDGRGWKPACPPSGTHHYRFTVYAFSSDETAALEGESLEATLAFLADRAIAWGRLTGTVTASGGDSGGGY